MIDHTPLSQYKYEVIHTESPDWRGIDVALIFRPVKFSPIHYESIPISFPFDKDLKTRDILYTKGLLFGKDTLHIFINHWPSRYGGTLKSKPKRDYVANVLRHKIDSVLHHHVNPRILIMGDFNDEPSDESLSIFLKAKTTIDSLNNHDLLNLMALLPEEEGSHKYHERWSYLDQIIVSGNIYNGQDKLQIDQQRAHVFKAPFLLEKDERNLGLKPFRTYGGPNYLGGFSDHLPVFIDIIYTDSKNYNY